LEDPIVWVLIIAAVVFLFGGNKIPELARSLGQARREFSKGWKGILDESMTTSPVPSNVPPVQSNFPPQSSYSEDPLLTAARREGITTEGKTKQQIASELSSKLNQGKEQGA
jgi:sec-independent protein translocase protein TatA